MTQTERAASQQQELSADFLAAIVDSSDDAIIGKTLDGTIISWNPGAEQLYGYTADEAIGQPISILLPPERSDELREILDRVRRNERVDHFQTTRVRKSGERITVSVTISPVHDGRGEVIGASAIARDITSQQRAIGEAIKLREEFISIAAHELRNPLAILYGRLQLAERRIGRPDVDRQVVQRDLARAAEAAERLRQLLDRLLNISRISSGRLELERAATDIGSLVRTAVSAIAESSGREIGVRAEDGEAARASVDGLRLEQVLVNLLENAVKYTPAATPIDVEVTADHDGVRIAVRDHGDGVPPPLRERMFMPFERGSLEQSGAGLGLYVAREIVALHGGALTYEQPPDGGARFVVTLPKSGNGTPA